MKTAGGYTSSGRKKPVTLKEVHANKMLKEVDDERDFIQGEDIRR